MRKIKLIAAVAAIATLSTTLAGCGSSSSSSSSASGDKELTKVTLMLDWTANTNHTGIYVADALGYFAEEGIDVEIVEAAEAGAEASVANGTVDFGISFQDYLVPAFSAEEAEQLPVTAVAAIIQHNTSGIISSADANIESAADMAGNSYATWEMAIEQAIIKEVVTQDGGNYDDIEMIPTSVENIAGAFESGIDAVWIYYAWDGINCELQGLDFNYFYFADYAEELDNYSPVIIANNDFLSENPELAKSFMAAVTKGYEYSIENPSEAAKMLVDANEGLDLELCTKSMEWLADKYQADADKWGVFDADRWDAFYSWVYENGLCEYEIPAGFGFSNEYLPE